METERPSQGQNACRMEFKTTTVIVMARHTVMGRRRNTALPGPSETLRGNKYGGDMSNREGEPEALKTRRSRVWRDKEKPRARLGGMT